jgi:hypothetical protein
MAIRPIPLAVLFAGAISAAESNTSVAEVVMQQDHAALRSVLQKKADVNAPLVDGSTALHWAVENDDADALDLMDPIWVGPTIDQLAARQIGQNTPLRRPIGDITMIAKHARVLPGLAVTRGFGAKTVTFLAYPALTVALQLRSIR